MTPLSLLLILCHPSKSVPYHPPPLQVWSLSSTTPLILLLILHHPSKSAPYPPPPHQACSLSSTTPPSVILILHPSKSVPYPHRPSRSAPYPPPHQVCSLSFTTPTSLTVCFLSIKCVYEMFFDPLQPQLMRHLVSVWSVIFLIHFTKHLATFHRSQTLWSHLQIPRNCKHHNYMSHKLCYYRYFIIWKKINYVSFNSIWRVVNTSVYPTSVLHV